MDAAVAIDKGMDVDKPEGQRSGSDHRIESLGRSAVKGDHTVDQRPQIIRTSADMVRDRHAGFAVMFADKTSFLPESKLDEARVADHDGLQPEELFKIDRPSSCLGDGLTPTPDPILRRAFSFDGETRSRVLQQQEGCGAHEEIFGHRRDRFLRALDQVHGGKCFRVQLRNTRGRKQGVPGRFCGHGGGASFHPVWPIAVAGPRPAHSCPARIGQIEAPVEEPLV